MTYEEFINRPTELMVKIEHQTEDVAFKWTLCLNTSQGLSERVQTSPNNNQDLKVIRYAEANQKLTDLQDEYDKACEDVRGFLYKNLDINDADVLDWKYCSGKSITDIAKIRDTTYSGAANRISRAEAKARRKYAQTVDLRRFEKE